MEDGKPVLPADPGRVDDLLVISRHDLPVQDVSRDHSFVEFMNSELDDFFFSFKTKDIQQTEIIGSFLSLIKMDLFYYGLKFVICVSTF